MGANTSIQWTDATWNPVRGCSRVSEGCRNCYAERMAARFSGPASPFHGFAKQRGTSVDTSDGTYRRVAHGSAWTGKVELIPEKLDEPLRWRKPRRVFVDSMSDLFHESLSFEDIARVFYVMREAERHTFQVLTKRPARAVEFMRMESSQRYGYAGLRNLWLGTSCENQATADERIPLLLQTPAAKRFVSLEPLLGPVDLRSSLGGTLWIGGQRGHGGSHRGPGSPDCPRERHHHHDEKCKRGLDWVIVGGESGPGARPCDVAWIRSILNQCREAGVPCFVKQLGACWAHFGADHRQIGSHRRKKISWKGGNPDEWPQDLRVREFPA